MFNGKKERGRGWDSDIAVEWAAGCLYEVKKTFMPLLNNIKCQFKRKKYELCRVWKMRDVIQFQI